MHTAVKQRRFNIEHVKPFKRCTMPEQPGRDSRYVEAIVDQKSKGNKNLYRVKLLDSTE